MNAEQTYVTHPVYPEANFLDRWVIDNETHEKERLQTIY